MAADVDVLKADASILARLHDAHEDLPSEPWHWSTDGS
jgi:hypothetical protein